VSDSSDKDYNSVRDIGLLNSFQPFMIAYIEAERGLRKEVYIESDKIYTKTYLNGQEGIFSSKLHTKEGVFYINELTGESQKFEDKSIFTKLTDVPKNFKLKGSGIDEETAIPFNIYKGKNKDVKIEYRVSKERHIKDTHKMYNDFFYDGKLILQKKRVIREKEKEVVIKLISIDTLISNGNYINTQINKNKDLQLANTHIEMDSISYQLEIPDIFYLALTDEEIKSLNDYKNNSKYLMIDFWGTWCKPCMAAMPELKTFRENHKDQLDLILFNYKDSNRERVKNKILELEMDWDQGVATERVNDLLNPQTYFPGIIMFDDSGFKRKGRYRT
jgi:thiol-disulfide isomerase/thioredoxin